MAASVGPVGGYDYELFVSSVPEELKCGLCKKVARRPSLTSCCGEHFCKVCIEKIVQDKKPCPSCEEAEFMTFINKREHKKMLALEVRCAMKGRGCDWTGTLEQLHAHLDVKSDNCQYIDVKCPNKCEQPVQKHHLPTHLAKECTKRDFFCPYCNFKATYEVVCDDHWQQCPYYPIPCPNACNIMAIERGNLEAHLMLCPLEEVECEFSHAGCNVKLVRKEMERHLADNQQRHMLMMSQAVREKDKKVRQLEAKGEQNDKQIQELREKNEQQMQELEEKNQQIHKIVKQVQERFPFPHFTMTNFRHLYSIGKDWTSPPLDTGQGYRFVIRVWPKGVGRGEGTHVAVQLDSELGALDDHLKWPADCTITLQLLNQHRDQDHITVSRRVQWHKKAPPPKCALNDEEDKALVARLIVDGLCWLFSIKDPVIIIDERFVAHKDLDWNARRQTQYLKNDSLQFRIYSIQVHSV